MTAIAPRSGWSAVIASILSLVVGAVTAVYVFGSFVPAFNTRDTPVAEIPGARAERPPAPAVSHRLVLVVVDGLGFEEGLALEDLADLRARGVCRPLDVDFPSFTSPSIITMATGLGPRDHGIRLNGAIEGVPGLDTVVQTAVDAGLAVEIRPRHFVLFEELLRPPPVAHVVRGRAAFLFDAAARRLDPAPPRALWMIHFDEVDEAGHDHGSRSPEYAAASKRAARLIAGITRDLDLDRDTLVVVSDHGHLPEGGHGGDEAEVRRAMFLAAGRGVRSGQRLEARPLRDLPSTLAVLAGIATPASNTGRPMLDALDLDPPSAARALAEPFEQAARFGCRLRGRPPAGCEQVPALVRRLGEGDAPAREQAEAFLDGLGASREAELTAEVERARRHRCAWGAGFLALGIVGAALLRGRGRAVPAPPVEYRAWLAVVPYVVVYAVVMLAKGYGPTFSAMAPREYFLPDALLSVAAGAAAALAFAAWVRASPSTPFALLVLVAAPYAMLCAWVGAEPRTLVDPVAGVLVFQLSPLVVGIAVLVVPMSILARLRRSAL